mmetsp:Transcript_1194/g.4729  ORF Transcript_1194/g.4729 Transcript_1194/m.4729 type:complete len:407 (-) Transcript_1194:50-1270(-)
MLFAVGVAPSIRNVSQNAGDAGTALDGNAFRNTRNKPTFTVGMPISRIKHTPAAQKPSHASCFGPLANDAPRMMITCGIAPAAMIEAQSCTTNSTPFASNSACLSAGTTPTKIPSKLAATFAFNAGPRAATNQTTPERFCFVFATRASDTLFCLSVGNEEASFFALSRDAFRPRLDSFSTAETETWLTNATESPEDASKAFSASSKTSSFSSTSAFFSSSSAAIVVPSRIHTGPMVHISTVSVVMYAPRYRRDSACASSPKDTSPTSPAPTTAAMSTTGSARELPNAADATAAPLNSGGVPSARTSALPITAPSAMFTHALRGRSHTFRRWSMVTLLPSATKRRHGRNTAPFSLAILRQESSSRRPRRRAKHPTPPMMNTFRTALHDTTKMSSATDIAASPRPRAD